MVPNINNVDNNNVENKHILAAPPPGFEHVVPGKRGLSGRARQLMGEHVEFEEPKDYSTPEPIPMPERELREQQHFIGE